MAVTVLTGEFARFSDNDSEFGSQFHYHVLDRGIGHVYIKPATPVSTARSRDSTAYKEEVGPVAICASAPDRASVIG